MDFLFAYSQEQSKEEGGYILSFLKVEKKMIIFKPFFGSSRRQIMLNDNFLFIQAIFHDLLIMHELTDIVETLERKRWELIMLSTTCCFKWFLSTNSFNPYNNLTCEF